MKDAAFTTVARSLVAIGEALVSTFETKPVGPGARVLRVQELLGPSTEGGKRSRQPLALTNAASIVVIGWLDAVAAECSVKEYPMLKLANELRGGPPLDFSAEDYAAFTALFAAELARLGVRLKVDVIDPAELRTEKTLQPAGRVGRASRSGLLIATAVFALAVAAVAAAILLAR